MPSLNDRIDTFIAHPQKALWTLAWPIVLGMLFQIFYNIVDTAFIGRLGVDQLAAATFSFPIFFLFIAIANLIGFGVTTLIAQYLGARKKAEAENVAWHAFFMSGLLAIIVTIVGLFFAEKLFSLLGATPSVVAYGVEYMRPLFIGSIFIFLSSAFRAVLMGEGNTRLPTLVQVVSSFLNLFLDWLFIVVFGWGMTGASLSTALAFVFNVIVFSYTILFKGKNGIHFRLRSWSWSSSRLWRILKIGVPTSLAQMLMATGFLFFNGIFAAFGTGTVAAYGLVGKVDSMIFLPLIGLGVAIVTLSGMFYGAKRYDLLSRVIKTGLLYGYLYVLPVGLFIWLFPHLFFHLLTNDAIVIAIASSLQRVEVFSYPLIVIGLLLGRLLLGLGDGLAGLVITGVRLVIVAVPLAWLFTKVLGYGPISVIVAMICAGLVSVTIAIIWTRRRLCKVRDTCEAAPS